MKLLRFRDGDDSIGRIGGAMAVVLTGSEVRPGDDITVEMPPNPPQALAYIANSHKPDRVPPHPEPLGNRPTRAG